MKKYLITYHMNDEAMAEAMKGTPESREEGMKPWFTWKEQMGESLLDFGSPLMGSKTISPDGSLGQSSREMAGYSMIKAENMEEATELLKDHPHLKWNAGCNLELHEIGDF